MIKLFTIPNLLTLSSVMCGCFSIVCSVNGNFDIAFVWIFIGMIFDFADGFTARLLHQSSPIGLQLDSLADMVTFGVAPSMSLFYSVQHYFSEHIHYYFGFLSFFIVVFSGLRLAKFNVDTRQTDTFIGLPTPANALLIAPIALIINRFNIFEQYSLIFITVVFLLLIAASCYFLISEISMFSLKVKNFNIRNNLVRYVFLLFSIILFFIFSFTAFPFIIFIYIILSIINIYFQRN